MNSDEGCTFFDQDCGIPVQVVLLKFSPPVLSWLKWFLKKPNLKLLVSLWLRMPMVSASNMHGISGWLMPRPCRLFYRLVFLYGFDLTMWSMPLKCSWWLLVWSNHLCLSMCKIAFIFTQVLKVGLLHTFYRLADNFLPFLELHEYVSKDLLPEELGGTDGKFDNSTCVKHTKTFEDYFKKLEQTQ